MASCSGCGVPLGLKKYKFNKFWRIPGSFCKPCMLKIGQDWEKNGKVIFYDENNWNYYNFQANSFLISLGTEDTSPGANVYYGAGAGNGTNGSQNVAFGYGALAYNIGNFNQAITWSTLSAGLISGS